ncbi:isoflavone 3'-hydroxylase-like [Cicer arietinum]|uniref:Isoflavone 3'-hydroxylase-like n=1 Tax=Cicer arietinum TaxID=3827 RepID=A0A3Q7K7B4_CICAR|nr:isoflavone 3'-hydroxylase-like [Cicer arietinum]
MTPLLYYSLLSITFIITIKIILQIQSRKLKNLPPGPPTIPIIGNLHHLKHPIHRTFTTLSQKYGDVLSLWFGSRLVVVVSSPSLVNECFTKNDIILANRPQFLTGKYIFNNYTTLGSASYGDHWRNLRRITTIDVLSNNRLNSFLGVRTDETNRLVQKLLKNTISEGFTKVELRHRLTEMTFNGMMRMISGKRYYGDDGDVTDVEEAKQFRDIISEIMSLLGANNKGDFLPLLRLFDLDDLEKRCKRIAKRADAFLQGLIEEIQSGNQNDGDTMIDHLLKLRESQPEYYSDHMIKGLIQAMLLAGTDTSAVAIEWVMSELLNHPDVLNKAKEEIETQIGRDKLIEEHDLSKLPYLQNIINETLRLHPPAPLLLPHYSSEDFTLGGFNVPKDTIILSNVWAIHRDPNLWSDPLSFKPERFEIEGELNKLIAFGLGRRACPGLNLAQRSVGLTVGMLIQCFEWKRESDEKLDMMEDKGITMPKKVPLEAMCKPLPIVNDIMK